MEYKEYRYAKTCLIKAKLMGGPWLEYYLMIEQKKITQI